MLCVKQYVPGGFRRLVSQISASVLHPDIQLVVIGENNAFFAAKMSNRESMLGMPSLDGTATAAKIPGNGLPRVQPVLRKGSFCRC
jgi:hypothetical protein